MTHKPKPPEAVFIPFHDDEKLQAAIKVGISDITAACDTKLTLVNIANEAFGACRIRVAMLEGQLAAEKDRLCELAAQLKMATDDAVKEACK